MSEVRLQVKHVSKNFGITKALKDVSFNINKGEVHALIGENGSGKSTMTNMLTGIYTLESGQFILDGKEVHPKNQVEANEEGISIIVQELGTLSGLTVAENIFLGHEDQFVHLGIKNTAAMNKKANELLQSYGFDKIKAGDMIDDYNFEDRKLVEIVKATYFNPKIVVVDETTTALSQEGREELYKQMNQPFNNGNTVNITSHDLPEILDKSDTITILRDGVYIDTVKSKDVTEDDLKKLMVGREVTGDYYRADYGEKVSDEVVLSVKNVTVPGLIEDVTFDLHKGEILGFGGLSESGMHEIGKAIFGASYDRTGSVTLADGTQINDIPTAIKHSIAYTSKDRDNESVVLNQSIGDNICLPSLDELAGKSHLLSDKKRKEFADKYPEAKIVASAKAIAMLPQFFEIADLADRAVAVKEGEELSLGSHTLQFFMAPMVHWPEVMVEYEKSEKILFSADAFGKFGALDADEDWACEARRYYFNIVGKYGAQVQALLKKAATLDIQTICPLHGPILKENLGYYIGKYMTWSSYEPEDDGVLVAYASIHGNTAKAAKKLADMLRAEGVEKVVVSDLAREDMAEVIEDAFRYDRMVLCAASYDGGVFPCMQDFLNHLQSKAYQKRTVGILENGSWAPCAARTMKTILSTMKDVTIVEPTVTIMSTMKESDYPAMEALVNAIK